MPIHHIPTFGASVTLAGVKFSVWAPAAKALQLILFNNDGTEDKRITLHKDEKGIFTAETKEAPPGTLYKYIIDNKGPFPDPASQYQPEGVHGCSQVVDHSTFKWSDQPWKGIASLEQVVVYELHVGTFTREGTFKAVIPKLEYLKNELGVSMIELLPVADWPGRWNWGYDGVALYAPARAYGTPDDLKRLVDAAHNIGLGIIIDLVYNHLGPDGNYLSCYNPHYFTAKHHTPWGPALNYDLSTTADRSLEGRENNSQDDVKHAPFVRSFIVDNAVSWMHDYHFDGARLDATHAIVDYSKPHVLQELVDKCRAIVGDRKIYFFAEDERNEVELVTRQSGLDSLWADDFHHQVRVAMTGENESYFANFTGSTKDLAETIRKGWFFCGQNLPDSGQPRGTDPVNAVSKLAHFCCCIQNHDQIGNRAMGERLNHQIALNQYKAASALLLLVPETPMLFQGQEWASSSPFQYFTDHNAELGKLVTEGRRKEFSKFRAFTDPSSRGKIPDPQAECTFLNSKLKWDEVCTPEHQPILKLYQALLKLRTTHHSLRTSSRDSIHVQALDDHALILVRKDVVLVVNLCDRSVTLDLAKIARMGEKRLEVILTTEDDAFITKGDKGLPPTLESHSVHFARASALVLQIKA